MNFKFGNTPTTSTQGASSQLAAYKIHDVKFDGLTADTIEKKDGSATFSVIRIKFSNDNGGYEHVIFEPKAGDDVRQKNSYDYFNPAPAEEMLFVLRHLLAAVAPTVSKSIDDKGGFDVNGWEALRKFMVTNTVKAVGTSTQIKLMGDKDNRGQFPRYVLALNKKDEVYPRTNFIGNNLTFTANELKQIEAKASAQVTKMGGLDATEQNSLDNIKLDNDDLDIDLNDL